MKPIEFYDWAVNMAGAASSESAQRTVISRLYYGLHHEACCRYFSVNTNAPPLTANQRHAALSNVYNRSNDPTCRAIGNLLRDLKILRGIADYDLSSPRFRGKAMSIQTLMGIALIYGKDLAQQLDLFNPQAALDGCNCPVA